MGRKRQGERKSQTLPVLLTGESLAPGGVLWAEDLDRGALRKRLAAGELEELEFEAVVFRAVYPNRNFVRFRPEDLGAFAASFVDTPFLRNHDLHDVGARDGTVIDAWCEGPDMHQKVRLTTQRGIGDFLNGVLDRFSIGWYAQRAECSVCGQDWLKCDHWPGEEYAVDGRAATCELVMVAPQGRETSAVNAPAVDGTGVLEELCLFKERMGGMKTVDRMDGVDKVDGALGQDPAPVAGAAPAASASKAGAGPGGAQAEAAAAPATMPAAQDDSRATAELAALKDDLLQLRATWEQERMQERVLASGLSAAGQAAVWAAMEGRPPAQLERFLEAQRTAEAAVRQASVVRGMEPTVTQMQTSLDRVAAALESLILGVRPPGGVRPLNGIREAYIQLSGDYDMKGVFMPEHALAAVNSATMAGLVANALNKAVVNQFQQYPRWWEPIVAPEDFTSLQQVRWVTLGGIGELPRVREGAAYSELTWGDQTEVSDWDKTGGYLGITLETIDKDDTRRVQMAPRALAQAAWLTLGKSIAALFTGNGGAGPTMSDGKTLFHTDHANLGSTALSYSAWTATRAAMRKQTELNSSERLGALVAPKFLLVPSDLEGQALTVLLSEGQAATSNNDENPWAEGNSREARLAAAQRRVITVDLWTDANDWAAVADPLLYPSIGLGFRFGRTPEIFSLAQANTNGGLMFTNDLMPIKVRWFFAVGPTDWRGLYKHNVA
jgi:hypothetical protein